MSVLEKKYHEFGLINILIMNFFVTAKSISQNSEILKCSCINGRLPLVEFHVSYVSEKL